MRIRPIHRGTDDARRPELLHRRHFRSLLRPHRRRSPRGPTSVLASSGLLKNLKVQRSLKHKSEELTMEQSGIDLRVEEGIRSQESESAGSVTGSVAPGSVDEGKSSENNKGKGRLGKVTKSSKFKKKPKENTKDFCWVCSGPHLKKDCKIWKEKRAQRIQSQGNSDHGHGSSQEK
nr:zinc finger, CCHC-type [Ipomoea batatas]